METFHPVTPGLPMSVIGGPVFEKQTLQLNNGKTFQVVCKNYSPGNKFIQSAKLNGKDWNKSWAAGDDALPPSFEMK